MSNDERKRVKLSRHQRQNRKGHFDLVTNYRRKAKQKRWMLQLVKSNLGEKVFPAVFGLGVEVAPIYVNISPRTAKHKEKQSLWLVSGEWR